MKYLPITLICVLTSSLFMALLFVPVLGTVLNNLARIFLQFIIPLTSAQFVFNLISYLFQIFTLNINPAFSLPLTIIKYLFPILYSFLYLLKIIPRVYKLLKIN